jgi:hypothetical protein
MQQQQQSQPPAPHGVDAGEPLFHVATALLQQVVDLLTDTGQSSSVLDLMGRLTDICQNSHDRRATLGIK